MKVLVTGATGFLGQYLVKALSSIDAFQVYAVARNPSKLSLSKNAAPVICDISKPDWTSHLPPDCEAVIHTAQSENYRLFPEKAQDVFAVNVHATFELAEWARKNAVRKCIYTSTASVYGSSHESVLGEDGNYAPDSFYAASKTSAEALFREYHKCFCIDILRIFTLYGPGQTDRLIPSMIQNVQTGKEATIVDDKGICITPVHVQDVVTIIEKLLSLPAEVPCAETYNTCGDEQFTLKEIVQIIAQEIGTEARFKMIAGKAPRIQGTNDKIKRKIPGLTFTPFRHGIKETIQKLLQNQDG